MAATYDMTTGKPAPLMRRFAIPIMFGSVLEIVYVMADGMIVGRLIGVDAFAAVGAAGFVLWAVFSIHHGIVSAFNSAFSQRFGAKDGAGFRVSVAMAVWIVLVLGGLLGAVSFAATVPVLRLLNTPAEILADAQIYLHINFAALPVIFFAATVNAVLFATGNSRIPSIVQAASFILNVVFSILVVLFTPWGVMGVAAVTVVSRVLTCLFCLVYIYKNNIIRLKMHDFRLDFAVLKKLIALGLPIGIRDLPPALVSLLVLRQINSFGAAYIAGISAALKLYSLLFPWGEAFAAAIGTFAGQNYGAKNYDRAALGLRTGLKIMLVGAVVIIAAVAPFREFIISLFIVGDDAALAIGVRQLSVLLIFLPTYYIAIAHRAYFPAVGNGFWPMISGFLEAGTRLVTILVLPALIGEWGLYLTEVAGWPVMAVQLVLVRRLKACKLP